MIQPPTRNTSHGKCTHRNLQNFLLLMPTPLLWQSLFFWITSFTKYDLVLLTNTSSLSNKCNFRLRGNILPDSSTPAVIGHGHTICPFLILSLVTVTSEDQQDPYTPQVHFVCRPTYSWTCAFNAISLPWHSQVILSFSFFRSFPFPQNVVARQERQNHVGGLHWPQISLI